ncbi:MAG: hypothetical protein KC910_32380 [Candidatus Eremiobacteraeota bacterium]|nr:hypothetical protein [Candidatus Eremiobacteraeota bacterium]
MVLEVLLGFAGGVAWSAVVSYRLKRKSALQLPPPPPPGPVGPGTRQAAIVLMSLPPETSAGLFSQLTPEVVHQITWCIAQLPTIDSGTRQQALDAFRAQLGSGNDLHQAIGASPRAAAAAILKLMLADEPVATTVTR